MIDQPKMPPCPNSSHKLEQDIRITISSLTHHLASLGTSCRATDHGMPSDTDGMHIISLTSSNKGAAMKVGMLLGHEKAMRGCTNSNYQAINNSVLLGGSCTAEDPGVHISFLDFEEEVMCDKKKDQKGMEKLNQSVV